MSDYNKAVDFAAKDALSSGNPSKVIVGTEIDDELNALSVAISTKYDSTDLADQSTAEGGTSNTKLSTPLSVAQYVAAYMAAYVAGVGITGGTIDGTVIGGSTPAAGAFTTVSASGTITGNVTGNLTGDVTGDITGNVTGNVTGDVTGDVTGNLTGDVTGTSSDSTLWDGKALSIVSSLPGSPDSNTIYLITA